MAQRPFNPDTAPKAVNTPDDIRLMRREMNDVIVKLYEAGVQLQGNFKWRMAGALYWNPTGFDFMCEDWKRLLDLASRSQRLGFDIIDMPGDDPWKRACIKSVGFTQLGKPPLAHLDIAVDRPGLCRVYVLTHSDEIRIDALRRAKAVTAKDRDVYKKIYRRLFALGIDLDLHIGSHLTDGRDALDGINFVARDHNRLITALTDAKYPDGSKTFARGSRMDRGHLPLSLSFLATEGVGFRQIWWAPRPGGPASGSGQTSPSMDPKFSGNFGDSLNQPDLSSLHCAISKRICNIHIDQMGFVMRDADGNIIVDPDALRHILVELVWKTDLQGHLPFWMLDRVNFDIPSSPLEFSRLGVGIDLLQSKKVKATIHGSCAIDGSMDCSGTIAVAVKF